MRSHGLVLDRLFANGQSQPAHPAVWKGDHAISYGAFCRQVRTLAAELVRIAKEPRVLIHLPQGADAYAGMFATLAAGGVYAPINLESPLTKQRAILQEFEPHVVISTAELYAKLCVDGGAAPLVDVHVDRSDELGSSKPPHRLAYVMFTSGSTGKPKGVMIPRIALQHYADWAVEAMPVTPQDRWSQHPNIAFDVSVLDIFGALCGGATLFPINSAMDRLMPAMSIKRHALTIWNSVPSVVNLMVQSGQMTRDNLESLRLITFCGEALLPEHLEAIFSVRPDIPVHNTYGPTETTVSVTLLRVDASNYRGAVSHTVALGDPIGDMDVFIDGGGDTGEILISGPQLADGYWGEANARAGAVFTERVIDGVPRRVYRTGDLGQRIGRNLYFKSRLDNQTKIKGFRLELDEVNGAMRRCGLQNAVSAVVEGTLHAFIESDRALDIEALRKGLAQWLEPHAIPTEFHFVAMLPRNDNDKIDIKALARGLGESRSGASAG